MCEFVCIWWMCIIIISKKERVSGGEGRGRERGERREREWGEAEREREQEEAGERERVQYMEIDHHHNHTCPYQHWATPPFSPILLLLPPNLRVDTCFVALDTRIQLASPFVGRRASSSSCVVVPSSSSWQRRAFAVHRTPCVVVRKPCRTVVRRRASSCVVVRPCAPSSPRPTSTCVAVAVGRRASSSSCGVVVQPSSS